MHLRYLPFEEPVVFQSVKESKRGEVVLPAEGLQIVQVVFRPLSCVQNQ